MKSNSYYIYINAEERSLIINSLIKLRNSLIKQGRYTDAVDDVIYKITNVKKKKVKIQYI